MSAHILTIAQQKGGAGKTTLVAHLGVAFHKAGKRTALLDIDPQASLTAWYRQRQAAGGANGLSLSEVAGWRASTEIDKLKHSHDLIIIDSPPHAETEAKVAVRSANLVLIPIQPSPMDLWATDATVELARAAKVPVLLVLNRVPPRSKIVEVMRGQIAAKDMPVTTTTIGNRTAFAGSMLAGRSAMEDQPRSTAAQEIRRLAEEIAGKL